MKFLKLKEKLKNKYKTLDNGKKGFKRIKSKISENKNEMNENDLKIIGITGSAGKSTTALIVHEYLKMLGYKSVLYSSAKIDSPASIIKPDEACEISFNSEEELLDIIEEVEAYGADFLVLEVNESTIEKGITKEIPFTVRALTNLNPKHNLERYSDAEYIEIKKAFFKDIEDECKCVLGFQDYDKKLLEELLKLNDFEKFLFTSNYIADVKGVDSSMATCLLTDLESTLDGLKLNIKVKGKTYKLKSKLMMSYNALNFVGAMTILEALNILDIEQFEKCIYDINIPGRAEVFKTNGRLIVVDAHLPKMLECLKSFKDEGFISKIKVVVGSMGHGFKTWEDRYNSEQFKEIHKKNKKYAMGLLKQNADFVYLTENDNAADNVLDICLELQGYLEGDVPSMIVEDRREAIRQSIIDSKEGDVIFISGRGNRRILCNTKTTMKLLKDSEVVKETLEELGW